jgi:hypothetical protein
MQAQPQEETSYLFHSGPQDPLANQRVLGATGFCSIWTPNSLFWLSPSMKPQRGGEQEPLVWGEEQGKTFREIKRALTNALP